MSWTDSGKGSCPQCKKNYNNRYKPTKCDSCDFHLGGSYVPKPKKKKAHIPCAVSIAESVYSVKTSNRGDRCLVCNEGKLWICLHEKCKERRAMFFSSKKLADFTCDHTECVKRATEDPLMAFTPQDLLEKLPYYPCSKEVKSRLEQLVEDYAGVIGGQISDSMFVVYGAPSASNTLGFCHVKVLDGRYVCTGKDCKGVASKAKQTSMKQFCYHIHLLLCVLGTDAAKRDGGGDDDSSASCHTGTAAVSSGSPSSFGNDPENMAITRASTLKLAKSRIIPYIISSEIIQGIKLRDCQSYAGLPGGWPEEFTCEGSVCGLCGAELGLDVCHQGQKDRAELLTELNAFKEVKVLVKICPNKECKAMNQCFPINIGKFFQRAVKVGANNLIVGAIELGAKQPQFIIRN